MVRVELPESRFQLRKRKRRIRLSFFAGGLLVVLCGALVGVAHIPAMRVREVQVTGARTLASTTVAMFARTYLEGSYLWLFPKDNIFLYPKKSIAKSLLTEYPMLSVADVHASDFHSIVLALNEREPRALWCPTEGGCYFMDEGGAVFAPAPTFSQPVYNTYQGLLSGDALPKQFLLPEQFRALSALVDAISTKLSSTEALQRIVVDDSRDVRMYFTHITLLFTLEEQSGDVFERLGVAFQSKPFVEHPLSAFEYLDLRFGDKLYYKLRNVPE